MWHRRLDSCSRFSRVTRRQKGSPSPPLTSQANIISAWQRAIREIDEVCWFDGRPATVRAVVDHSRQIENADPQVPIILSSDGHVLDGMHRVAKAILEGPPSVPAQRLLADPEPDWLVGSSRPE
jgi:hypothetical protein